MNRYKLVRNRVPQLFELHHGYKPDTLEQDKADYWPNKKTFILNKINEELEEVLEEATAKRDEVDLRKLYEEAADVVAALEALLAAYSPDCATVRETLQFHVADKERKYGCMRGNKIIRVSDEERKHYYDNIKNKVEDEYGEGT